METQALSKSVGPDEGSEGSTPSLSAKVLVVIPAIKKPDTDRCLMSIVRHDSSLGLRPKNCLVVDNSRDGFCEKYRKYGFQIYRDPDGHNIGVAGAWNVGAQKVLDKHLTYLLIVSTSVEFGPLIHCSFFWHMEQNWEENVIEAQGHSWHLIAFHRRIFEQVGLFDENFYPAYFEAIDFGYRMRMLDLERGFVRVWVNAMSWGVARNIDVVDAPAPPLLRYYRKKWGGDKGEERWETPFGNTKPINYWRKVPVPEMARLYRLQNWW